MTKLIIILLAIFTLIACEFKPECVNPTSGKAVLVGYKVAKHSHLYLKNPETNVIYDKGGMGGRREPSINLGDTISVQYCKEELLLDASNYAQNPIDRTSRKIMLNNY